MKHNTRFLVPRLNNVYFSIRFWWAELESQVKNILSPVFWKYYGQQIKLFVCTRTKIYFSEGFWGAGFKSAVRKKFLDLVFEILPYSRSLPSIHTRLALIEGLSHTLLSVEESPMYDTNSFAIQPAILIQN